MLRHLSSHVPLPNDGLSRRGFLVLAGSGAVAATGANSSCGAAPSTWMRLLQGAEWQVLDASGQPADGVLLERDWQGTRCALRLRNTRQEDLRIREVEVFSFPHTLPTDTPFYAEGSQMLSQTIGTIAEPEDLGQYTDAKHYRLPSPAGAFTAYNLMQFRNPEPDNALLAFTSCYRFQGKFHLWPDRLTVAIDLDNVVLPSGETIPLETFALFEGGSVAQQLEALGEALREAHPPIHGNEPPEGWCSWYCFGPQVTAEQVMANLHFIQRQMPSLRYIQIDDGYQSAMGDWLKTGQAFGGDVRTVLSQIKQAGFEPAIWVAPFIAEAGSDVFQQHPDWFMKGPDGNPLASNEVTFGGWRRGPWYAMDGTHPEVQRHFETLFRTMREEWGVTYFKLDANFWGMMPQGRIHDQSATRVEAYRRGMEAIRRGAGDAFLLGCNHPMWPSLGLIHGSRSSNDIARRWKTFRQVARENLCRGWQNGQLWWNDPDVVLLMGELSEDEFQFHAASIYASGGMLLAGDDLPQLSAERLAMLRKLSPPTGKAAAFDADLRIGRLEQDHRETIFVFNWTEDPQHVDIEVEPSRVARNFWTEAAAPVDTGHLRLNIPPHSARVFVLA